MRIHIYFLRNFPSFTALRVKNSEIMYLIFHTFRSVNHGMQWEAGEYSIEQHPPKLKISLMSPSKNYIIIVMGIPQNLAILELHACPWLLITIS